MGRKLSRGNRTENVDFWRVTLLLYLCMWLLGSPDTDIVYVHLATDMECGLIAEDVFLGDNFSPFPTASPRKSHA
jgi:hypothetical protein